MNLKADPFRNQERWLQWKRTLKLTCKSASFGLSPRNYDLTVEYLLDMEAGYNVATKGRLSYIRLNNLKQRLTWILANLGIPDVTQAKDREILCFFNKMKDGSIRRLDGKPFRSTSDYMKVFIAFWHWYQRRSTTPNIPDITRYLAPDDSKESDFVYFTIDHVKRVAEQAKYQYRVMLWLLFDSGIRSPTELLSLRIGDFSYLADTGIYELDIRDEYAKTFGRKIKLVLCSDILKAYLNGKKPDDPFFQGSWEYFRRYLRKLFLRVFGDQPTKGGKSFGQIRPYDFRHSAACYWIIRYKKEAAFKYRFGWKENRMIHYYTRLLGMEDTNDHSTDDFVQLLRGHRTARSNMRRARLPI